MPNAFDDYWRRMKLREEFGNIGRIHVKKWYDSEGLNEIEEVYFSEMKDLASILEIGSGTNSLQKKFHDNGYGGLYHTMDLSREFPHDYHDLSEIEGVYDGIVILEVIEHMSLQEFRGLLEFIDGHLAPRGKLAISTPHSRSISPWASWDMTHVQQYPLHDLYTLFRTRGFSAKCYRVWCQKPHCAVRQRVRLFLRKVLCYILGVDYVDSVALILQREESCDKAAPEAILVGEIAH